MRSALPVRPAGAMRICLAMLVAGRPARVSPVLSRLRSLTRCVGLCGTTQNAVPPWYVLYQQLQSPLCWEVFDMGDVGFLVGSGHRPARKFICAAISLLLAGCGALPQTGPDKTDLLQAAANEKGVVVVE